MTTRTVLMTADAVGGVWRYTVDLGAALTKQGVSVVVALMGPAPSADDRREAERAGLVIISRPYRLEWMDNPWDDVRRAADWLKTLERMVQPDVIHLNGFVHAALPWSKPVVVVGHSCVRTWWAAVNRSSAPPELDYYTKVVKAGLVAASAVVTPTDAMRAALEAEYGLSLDATVIPNGKGGTSTAAAGGSQKEKFVLSAGRTWDEGKNIVAVCTVAAELPWPVYVAGERRRPDGSLRELPNVRALGRLSSIELAAWYDRASIYVLPARYEPFGLSVLEAASARCALVLGDIGSLRELWDGAAMFVPPDDTLALASAIRDLMTNDAYRHLLAGRAAARAASFSIDRMAEAYQRLYEHLIAAATRKASAHKEAASA